jgi:hypothetical protein
MVVDPVFAPSGPPASTVAETTARVRHLSMAARTGSTGFRLAGAERAHPVAELVLVVRPRRFAVPKWCTSLAFPESQIRHPTYRCQEVT